MPEGCAAEAHPCGNPLRRAGHVDPFHRHLFARGIEHLDAARLPGQAGRGSLDRHRDRGVLESAFTDRQTGERDIAGLRRVPHQDRENRHAGVHRFEPFAIGGVAVAEEENPRERPARVTLSQPFQSSAQIGTSARQIHRIGLHQPFPERKRFHAEEIAQSGEPRSGRLPRRLQPGGQFASLVDLHPLPRCRRAPRSRSCPAWPRDAPWWAPAKARPAPPGSRT